MKSHRRGAQSPVARRYLLYLDSVPGRERIEIVDRRTLEPSIVWRGSLVRELLKSGYLDWEQPDPSVLACSKSMVWHLALAAAGINIALRHEQADNIFALNRKLKQLGVVLPNPHRCVAKTVFEHPTMHFSHQELLCLFELESPFLSNVRCARYLRDLVSWGVIQEIDVAKVGTFYDSNTEPHLHVFDERTGRLYDAPAHGVVRTADTGG